jgi:UTP--glucose-1-phosphate uridylyltransferase
MRGTSMKGVIIAAGYGTRFLPVTKTIPKEMLPLLTRPAIDIVVEEFEKSGIDEILIITSRRKKALEDFFDREVELETVFREQAADVKLDKIKPRNVQIYFARQQVMRGTGHALLQARAFVGNEPFVAAYPDDLHFGEVPLAKQLIDVYEETGCTVLATVHDPEQLNDYAVPKLDDDGVHVLDIVEKPEPGTEMSREASIGRFLYTGDYLDKLEEAYAGHTGDGEFYHVDGIMKQIAEKKVVIKKLSGVRVDTGTPAGYLQALVHYVSKDPKLMDVLTKEVAKYSID